MLLNATNVWNLPWQEFDVVLGDKNFFLERNLNLSSFLDAQEFLKSCGIDITISSHVKLFEQILGEAIFFIRHHLMSDEERDVFPLPSDILHLESPPFLVLFASSKRPQMRYKRLWSCAILKIMFAIANIQFSGRLQILSDSRDAIFSKIKKYIHTDEFSQSSFLFHDQKMSLHKIEWKEAKTRTSLIMKLLHKPDSIVDEVFDYLGIRMVVENASDVPLLLKMLIESHVVLPHQVVSSRTRNSLLNVKTTQKTVTFLSSLASNGTISWADLLHMCKKIRWNMTAQDDISKKSINSFTSQHYRSLQFTVRHFVRAHNPAYTVIESTGKQLFRYTGINCQEPWMSSIIPEYSSHYFPIEIQIMDKESYEAAKFGPASHEQYKASQLKSIRERILGNLVFFSPEKLISQDF